jgi:hypothetical protein
MEVSDYSGNLGEFDEEDDDLEGLGEFTVGKKVQIDLTDMDVPSWKQDLGNDLFLIDDLPLQWTHHTGA